MAVFYSKDLEQNYNFSLPHVHDVVTDKNGTSYSVHSLSRKRIYSDKNMYSTTRTLSHGLVVLLSTQLELSLEVVLGCIKNHINFLIIKATGPIFVYKYFTSRTRNSESANVVVK